MVRSLYDLTECKDCASQNIIHNEKSMQIICKDCGLIYDPLKPVSQVGISLSGSDIQRERIIRPVLKKPRVIDRKVKRAVPKPVRKKAVKKVLVKRPKTLGAKMKGLMRKFMKR
jgi:PHP family Zn ribbon phosphoesterase